MLFHLRNRIHGFPKYRPPNQRWVHLIIESPVHCHLCTRFKNIFNLSATYTQESDFTSLYWTDSGVYWEENESFTIDQSIHNKNMSAVALISNCRLGEKDTRLDFIKELQNYMPVKIYGKCGKSCPSNGMDCRKYISNKYKFFLLFENSFCRDYITEKLFNTLKYNILPVVLGGGNYSYYIPKSAYINALDFSSAKNLTDYLIYLSSNQTAYEEYFVWKKYIKYVKNPPQMGFLCEMCIQLHLEDYIGQIKVKSLDRMKKRYGLKDNCKKISFDSVTRYYTISDQGLSYSYIMSPS